MNRSIYGKHIEIGDSLRDYINKTFDGFEKYNMEILTEKAVISENKKKFFEAEFIITIKGKHSIVIKSEHKDVYEAIAETASRVEKAIRRLSDKIKDHRKKTSLKELSAESAVLSNAADVERTIEDDIDNLIQMEMKLKKPMDIEDAIKKLREDDNIQFFVFNDRSGNMRTIYKRADGNIGVY